MKIIFSSNQKIEYNNQFLLNLEKFISYTYVSFNLQLLKVIKLIMQCTIFGRKTKIQITYGFFLFSYSLVNFVLFLLLPIGCSAL